MDQVIDVTNTAFEVKVSSATPAANDGTIIQEAKKPTIVQFSVDALAAIETARITWEQGSLVTSNDESTKVLQQCMIFCGDLVPTEARQRAIALEKFHNDRGYRYDREAPLETRVVRAVFGMANRRRISHYSIVLREAKKQNVSVMDLPSWIASKGGIQEIRLSQSKSFVSPITKINEMKNTLATRTSFIGVAKSELLSHLADGEFMETDCVLLARQLPDGGFGIYTVLRSDPVLNAAYLGAYSKSKAIEKQAKVEIEAANDADGKPVAA